MNLRRSLRGTCSRRRDLLRRSLGGFARTSGDFGLGLWFRDRSLRWHRTARNCVSHQRPRRRRNQAPGRSLWRCDWRSWRSGFRRRWRSYRRGWRFRNGGWRHRNRRLGSRRGGGFSFPAQGRKHIAGLGNVGEIDLGLDLLLARAGTAFTSGCSSALSGKMLADTIGFVELDGTRVGLLFRHSDFGKNVKNCLALDFELPGQIVDSNFTH